MQDKDDFAKLTATLAERRRYFTPDWFRDLLGARLSLGDTFWIGTYGTALIYVPGTVLLVLLARIALPPAAAAALTGLAFALLAVYHAALGRAVWRTALPRPEVGGWRWAGLAIALISAAGFAFYAMRFLAEALG